MRRLPRTLATRILLLAVVLVTLTALVAGLATVQFARNAARAEQHGELTAQASLLTLLSVRRITLASINRVSPGLDGTTLSVYGPSGRLVGTSAAGRTAPVVRRLRPYALQSIGGAAASGDLRVDGTELLVEARPTADGGAVVLSRPLAALTRTSSGLTGGILATLAICLVLAVLAAVWFARRLDAPLKAVASAARRLARGERGVAIPVAGPVEVVDVGDALTALDAALATSEGRQREFLLSISHELRTPLTALRGYGEALADGLVPPDRTAEVGRTLVDETVRLEHFTADLLQLARLEADDFSIHPEPLDLARLAEATVETWAGRAETLGVRLSASDEGAVPATGDDRRVRQVLDGLVENALRATPSGGEVRIESALVDGEATVGVEDTGDGLSDDDLADAFTRGLLNERYRETRAVGTGLGLSIATRLAARMHGRVSAEHARGHQGARFTLHLPTP